MSVCQYITNSHRSLTARHASIQYRWQLLSPHISCRNLRSATHCDLLMPRTRTITYMNHAVRSLWTVCLEWPATDPASITRNTQTVSKHNSRQWCFVQPTRHDLALSSLFRPLEQRDINLLTYLLTYLTLPSLDRLGNRVYSGVQKSTRGKI